MLFNIEVGLNLIFNLLFYLREMFIQEDPPCLGRRVIKGTTYLINFYWLKTKVDTEIFGQQESVLRDKQKMRFEYHCHFLLLDRGL